MSFLEAISKEIADSAIPPEEISFKNPTLKSINDSILEQEEFSRQKPTIRQGIYQCPKCREMNTMHYTVAYSGDEAARVYAFCNLCKIPFTPSKS